MIPTVSSKVEFTRPYGPIERGTMGVVLYQDLLNNLTTVKINDENFLVTVPTRSGHITPFENGPHMIVEAGEFTHRTSTPAKNIDLFLKVAGEGTVRIAAVDEFHTTRAEVHLGADFTLARDILLESTNGKFKEITDDWLITLMFQRFSFDSIYRVEIAEKDFPEMENIIAESRLICLGAIGQAYGATSGVTDVSMLRTMGYTVDYVLGGE